MKKLVSFILILAFALSLALSASADIIYDLDDGFFESHKSEFTYTDRRYIPAKGSIAQMSPYNEEKIFSPVYADWPVDALYTDENGRVWACLVTTVDGEKRPVKGWIPLECMSLAYDGVSFDAEHSAEFISADGITVDCSGGVVIFEFPFSPDRTAFASATEIPTEPDRITYNHAWADSDGHTWVNVSYTYRTTGYTHTGWICVDNPIAGYETANSMSYEGGFIETPNAPEIKGIHGHEDVLFENETDNPEPHRPGKNLKPLWIALAATAAVAAAAVVCAAVFVKKKKAK